MTEFEHTPYSNESLKTSSLDNPGYVTIIYPCNISLVLPLGVEEANHLDSNRCPNVNSLAKVPNP